MSSKEVWAPSPERVELTRIEICRDIRGRISTRHGPKPGVTSQNELLDGMAPGDELAVVEFHRQDRDGWFKEPHFREALLGEYSSSFPFRGGQWHLIGGTINGAGRGELLACTNRHVLQQLVPGWRELDGLNRVKTLSRLMQPSIRGGPFCLRMLVVDDPVHDGDAILSRNGVRVMQGAFSQPGATVFKCISHSLKVVFRRVHSRWDELPPGVHVDGDDLIYRCAPIDGVLYRDNIKLGKERYSPGQVVLLTERDFRLHSTEKHTNFHRSGLSRQLLQYLPAEIAEPLVAASDIPLMGSNWAKALTGDVEALKYLLHHEPDDNAEDHEIRNQLLRHLDAGCQDVTIPYLRQRVLPLLAGIFRNRIRKGRCPGAYLYVAPSTRMKRFELSVCGAG